MNPLHKPVGTTALTLETKLRPVLLATIRHGLDTIGLWSTVSKHCLPYAVADLGNNTYILLNRNYKPVGFDGADRVAYLTPEFTYALFAGPVDLVFTDVNGQRFAWLYNDETAPNKGETALLNYTKRLESFANSVGLFGPHAAGWE